MACRCVDIKNCLNDILAMKEIVKEFSELEKNIQRVNENLNKISSANVDIGNNEKELVKDNRKINRKLADKTPLIINEYNIKIENLQKQYRIIMKEDKIFHDNQNK